MNDWKSVVDRHDLCETLRWLSCDTNSDHCWSHVEQDGSLKLSTFDHGRLNGSGWPRTELTELCDGGHSPQSRSDAGAILIEKMSHRSNNHGNFTLHATVRIVL
jgi:hypothetical protein